MICRNCGKEIINGAVFCSFCGVRTTESENQVQENNDNQESQHCKKCGAKLKNGAIFCNKCGVSVTKPLEEKIYTFKEYTIDQKIKNTIQGKDIIFMLSEHMLAINQEVKFTNKITVIPYNEISSFEIKNKVNFVSFIMAVVFFTVGFWMLKFDDDEILIGALILFAMGILSIVLLPFYTQIRINMVYGKKMFYTLRRIGKKHRGDKETFVNDFTQRLNKTEKLTGITKEQTKINIGYTAIRLSEIVSEISDIT